MEDRPDHVGDTMDMIQRDVVRIIGYTDSSNVLESKEKERQYVALFEYNETGERFWHHVSGSFLESFSKK